MSPATGQSSTRTVVLLCPASVVCVRNATSCVVCLLWHLLLNACLYLAYSMKRASRAILMFGSLQNILGASKRSSQQASPFEINHTGPIRPRSDARLREDFTHTHRGHTEGKGGICAFFLFKRATRACHGQHSGGVGRRASARPGDVGPICRRVPQETGVREHGHDYAARCMKVWSGRSATQFIMTLSPPGPEITRKGGGGRTSGQRGMIAEGLIRHCRRGLA